MVSKAKKKKFVKMVTLFENKGLAVQQKKAEIKLVVHRVIQMKRGELTIIIHNIT